MKHTAGPTRRGTASYVDEQRLEVVGRALAKMVGAWPARRRKLSLEARAPLPDRFPLHAGEVVAAAIRENA